MWQEYLMISAWGGIVALDTTAAAQVMISHPLVSCSVAGLLLGNFPLGFLVGLILELVWLFEMPVGAAPFSEGNIGATVAAAVAILAAQQSSRVGIYFPLALMAGVVVSIIGGRIVILMRQLNSRIYTRLIEMAAPEPSQVTGRHLLCIFLMFVAGALFTLLSVIIFHFFSSYLCQILPPQVDVWLRPLPYAFLGVGCGVMIYIFATRKHGWMIAVGLLLGAVISLI